MHSDITQWSHIIYGRRRQKAERSATLALSQMAAHRNARGPLVAYVVASALADDLAIQERRIVRAAGGQP